jgi:glucokinase
LLWQCWAAPNTIEKKLETAMQKLIVGIDIGGTKVAGGLVSQRGKLVKSLVVPTRAKEGFKTSYTQIVQLTKHLVEHAGGKERIAGIGICAPGPLNPRTGLVINPPNLPGWRNVPLSRLMEKHLGLPTRVENDANAAGLAEVLFGAAAGHRDVFYVTVSTGIGTGIIIGREIYHGKNGVAGEGGHVSIDYRSPYRCGCGTQGCIEALAAGPGMARRARVHLEQEHTKPSLLRKLTGGHLSRITPKMIEGAARAGDPVAKSIIDETGFYLGVWLAGMITLFDPEAIVIGGGVARIGKPLFAKIRETIPSYTINRKFARKTPVLPAKLQTNVGVFGAASLFLPADKETVAAKKTGSRGHS